MIERVSIAWSVISQVWEMRELSTDALITQDFSFSRLVWECRCSPFNKCPIHDE